jgi:hypothetical protein
MSEDKQTVSSVVLQPKKFEIRKKGIVKTGKEPKTNKIQNSEVNNV